MPALKWLRVLSAAIVFVALTALFLDFTKTVPTSWHRLAHLQLTPALLGLGFGVLLFWLAATLLTGRIYCSVACPLGILQDLVSRVSKTLRGKRARHRYRPEMVKTRYAILVFFLVCLPALPTGVTLLDPYSHFGRIAESILKPAYLAGNNFLTGTAGEIGGVRFLYQSIHVEPAALTVALLALLTVGVLSALFGRRYCNTICPVGTLLGLVSRFAGFKVRLKSDCVSCGLCEKTCKGECIDSKGRTVDHSRCVACFNCLGSCRRGSIVYSLPPPDRTEPVASLPERRAAAVPVETEQGRRRFLRWSAFSLLLPVVVGTRNSAPAAAPPPDPSLPTGVSRIAYAMTHPILPPGAESRARFQRRCTGCHLCVSKCPANIVRPSTTELGLVGFLQPVMKFDYGFCNFDCTICTEVCPSHALVPKSKGEKHRIQIGRVVFLRENCVVETQGSSCGACAEHCPTGAIEMVPLRPPERTPTIPVVRPELCIGCGACEHICPVRPYRAIYVDGLAVHAEAELGYDPDAKQESVELDDFGF